MVEEFGGASNAAWEALSAVIGAAEEGDDAMEVAVARLLRRAAAASGVHLTTTAWEARER